MLVVCRGQADYCLVRSSLKVGYLKIELQSLPVKQSIAQIACFCVIMRAVTLLPGMLPHSSVVVSGRLTCVTATGNLLRCEIMHFTK